MLCRIEEIVMYDDTGCPAVRYGIRITEGETILLAESDLCGDLNMANRFCTDINRLQPDPVHLSEIIEDFVQECAQQ